VTHCRDPFEPGPATVLKREPLAPNLQLLMVRAPVVASKIQPGQFVIVRADEQGERIPLTVADWDREEGWVSCVVMQVGTSTHKLGHLQAGDVLPTFVGPLGKPLELDCWGTVVCAGGCYGIGAIYPVARALKARGNRVISLVEGRSKFLLYWLDRLETVSDRILVSTKDRSIGEKEYCFGLVRNLLASGEQIDRVFAIGCTFMMSEMADATRPFGTGGRSQRDPNSLDRAYVSRG